MATDSGLKRSPSASAAKWMSYFSDKVSVSALSIPGTHNSCAHYVSLPSVRCQNAPLVQQLDRGIRFLDIRLSRPFLQFCSLGQSRHELVVVHSAFPVCAYRAVTFSKVLGRVYAFLDANPSETVIMSLKHEGPFSKGRVELADILWSGYIKGHEHRWFLEPRMPSLGEARGKIILFRRFECRDEQVSRFGFPATAWKYNTPGEDVTDGTVLSVQDYCEVLSPSGIDAKSSYVRQHITRASSSNLDTLFLNFTTAANFWNPNCWPRSIATGVMSDIGKALMDSKGRCGVMVMDFPDADGWKIVRHIIDRNMDLCEQKRR
ncbi:PLC-like phosphodiesterase [Myxozyma melibiosi]|uniref:PLC-like phosphodiesterase n=1 Tax=Myxozyma melibiosi TaxID=54550 RepID=A0ABR1FFE6_9ASCO